MQRLGANEVMTKLIDESGKGALAGARTGKAEERSRADQAP